MGRREGNGCRCITGLVSFVETTIYTRRELLTVARSSRLIRFGVIYCYGSVPTKQQFLSLEAVTACGNRFMFVATLFDNRYTSKRVGYVGGGGELASGKKKRLIDSICLFLRYLIITPPLKLGPIFLY